MVTPAPLGGWDFSPGDALRDEVSHRFGLLVHFSSSFSSSPFRLVVDVPRSNFHLTTSLVALALRAAIGGSPSGFQVHHLIDRCFSFLVCSKSIGLWIYSLRSYTCKDFCIRFFLWRDGEPNWRNEFFSWQNEQDAEWTLVQRKHSSYAKAASSSHKDVPVSSVFSCLKWPLISSSSSPVIAGADVNNVEKGTQLDPFSLDHPRNSNLICFRCLDSGHLARFCKSAVRCNLCFNLGHIRRLCSKAQKSVSLGKSNLVKSNTIAKPAGKEVDTSIKSVRPMAKKQWVKKVIPSSTKDAPSSFLQLANSAPQSNLQASMANTNPNPFRFLRAGQVVHQGGDQRLPRVDLSAATRPPRQHEQYVLELWDDHRVLITNFLEQVQHFQVRRSFPHGSAVGLFKMGSVVIRDLLVYSPPFVYDGIHQVCFVHHDQGPNWRASLFTRKGWFLLLDFPLDYINMQYICLATSTFGQLDYWWEEDPIKGRVMLRAMYKDADSVPKKIVLQDPTAGAGKSWTISVFILEGEFADMFPPDEDLPLVGHNPGNDGDSGYDGGPDDDNIWQFGPNVHVEEDHPWDQAAGQVHDDAENLDQAIDNMGQVVNNDNWQLVTVEQTNLGLFSDLASAFTQFVHQWSVNLIPSAVIRNGLVSLPRGPPVVVCSSALLPVLDDFQEHHLLLEPTPLAVLPPDNPLLPDNPFDMPSDVVDVNPSPVTPNSRIITKLNPVSPCKRKRKMVTPLVDSSVRRSGRLLAIRDGFRQELAEDPNMGVGKPRGKAVRKLKQLADASGVVFPNELIPFEDLHSDISIDNSSDLSTVIPADCSVDLIQRIGLDMCGASLEEVSSVVSM